MAGFFGYYAVEPLREMVFISSPDYKYPEQSQTPRQ